MPKYTIKPAQGQEGAYYVLVTTLSGRTVYGTPSCKTVKEAEQWARNWVAGQREMAKAATEPTPLG